MKRIFLGVTLSFLTMFSLAYAGDDGNVRLKHDNDKEMRKLERKRKKEQRALERDQRKHEKAEKKASSIVKKEKKEKHKKTGEERELEKQHKKVSQDLDKEEKKHKREAGKEERKLEKIHREEQKKIKRIEDENRKKAKKEEARLKKQRRKEAHHIAILNEQKEQSSKLAKIEADKLENLKLGQNWQHIKASAVESDKKNGKYADLYMLPAWPVTNWFFNDKAMFNVTAFYDYVNDAYDSDGASKNITALTFGEDPIHIQDILLVSRLLSAGQIAYRDMDITSDEVTVSPINHLVDYWGSKEVKLNGRIEKYGLSLDFMRHVLRDDVTIGVQVPLMFMRNRLRMSMDFPSDYDTLNSGVSVESTEQRNFLEFASMTYQEAFKRILREKGINHLGGSASGLGDITLFGNVEISTKWIENIVAGLKFVLPTGKKSDGHRLWGPEMGNGGCTEIAAFLSMLVKYNKYVNPHLFLQAGFNIPTHVQRRPSRWVESSERALEESAASEPLEYDLMALADRFAYNVQTFSGWDSTIRGFGDRSISVKFEKGPEISARLGNVFDKFISRRGFMDIFYNLRLKFKDSYREVNRDMYDIDKLEDNTKQVEHRIGLEYSQQFDSRTRMKAGILYTFAGVNVPKAFDIGVSFAHSF